MEKKKQINQRGLACFEWKSFEEDMASMFSYHMKKYDKALNFEDLKVALYGRALSQQNSNGYQEMRFLSKTEDIKKRFVIFDAYLERNFHYEMLMDYHSLFQAVFVEICNCLQDDPKIPLHRFRACKQYKRKWLYISLK